MVIAATYWLLEASNIILQEGACASRLPEIGNGNECCPKPVSLGNQHVATRSMIRIQFKSPHQTQRSCLFRRLPASLVARK